MKKTVLGWSFVVFFLAAPLAQAEPADLRTLIAQYAAAHGVPEALVHRVVRRESNYNPQAVGRGGALGLMQIKHATARAMGYNGSASGLLDADTNLAYAVPYLAGAYRVAGGDQNRAVAYFASGYYYAAKRLGLTTAARWPAVGGRYASAGETEATGSVTPAAQSLPEPAADMR